MLLKMFTCPSDIPQYFIGASNGRDKLEDQQMSLTM